MIMKSTIATITVTIRKNNGGHSHIAVLPLLLTQQLLLHYNSIYSYGHTSIFLGYSGSYPHLGKGPFTCTLKILVHKITEG